jgi:uncharacterized paraquat-inducible protein A
MPVVTCPYCANPVLDDGSLAGQLVHCPRCNGHIQFSPMASYFPPPPPVALYPSNEIKCPHCAFGMFNDGRLAGQLVACPRCSGQLQLPPTATQFVQSPPVAVDHGKFGNDSFSVLSTAPKIEAWCDTCGSASQFTKDQAGAQVPCPHCGEILKVPASLKSAGIKKRGREFDHKISAAWLLMFVGCAIGYLLSWQLGGLVFSIGLILMLVAMFSSD